MRISEQFTAWRYITPQSHGESLILVMGKVSNDVTSRLLPPHIQASVIRFDKKAYAKNRDCRDITLPDCSVGMACVLCSNSSIYKNIPVRELQRVMNVGGGICFFVSIRGRLHSLQRFLEPHDFEFVQAYAVLPYFRTPRWIVPLSSRFFVSSAKSMFRPIKPIKWLLWNSVVKLSHLGLFPLIATNRLVIVKRKGSTGEAQKEWLIGLIQRVLGDNNLEVSLLVRPQKYYVKATAQVMDQEGRIVAYIKIATTVQAKHLLENEATTLRKLEQLKLQTADIPRLIYFGEIDQDTVLLQEAKYPIKPGPVRLSSQHISFLAELLNRTSKRWRFEESPLFSSLRGDTQGLNSSNCSGWSELLQSTSEKIQQRFAGQELQLGLAHKDFAPWNTCLNKEGQLIVFDWELACNEATPLMDFYNFVIHYEGFLRNKKGEQILAMLLSEKSPYFELLTQYKSAVGADPLFDHIGFLMIYLHKTSTYYLNYRTLQAQAGFDIDQPAEHLLTILRTMLDGVQKLG